MDKSTLFEEEILDLGFEFDMPYDINSSTLLDEILAMQDQLKSLTLKTNGMSNFSPQIGPNKRKYNQELFLLCSS
jgi:hypothetical protein